MALIRSLPKELRKRLVPVPDVAAKVLEHLQPRRGPLLEALAAEIEAQRGVRIAPDAWDLSRLPSYLRMSFSVEDEQGKVIASGQDLAALREQVRPKLRAALAAATRKLERTGQTSWTFGTIPKAVALPGTGQTVRAYPSLVDEGTTVGLRALESPEAQRAAHADGHAAAAGADDPLPRAQLPEQARQPGRAGADGGAARVRRRGAGGRGDGGDRGADGRAGVGRGLVRAAARSRRRQRRGRDGADHRRRRADPAGRARGALAAGRAARRRLRRRPPRRRARRSGGSCSPASSPRRAPVGCPTSSATCAAPNGGSSG